MEIGALVSHYRILERIGAGGMGVVYRAEDIVLGRSVAVKTLADDFTVAHPAAAGRLLAEARAASSLNHPNICTIYEVGEHDGVPFIAMELLNGVSLDRLAHEGAVEVPQLLTLMTQVAEALEAAHVHGVVHRDVKPANVFVMPSGHVKVLDFGLAKVLTRTEDEAILETRLTDPGSTLGTVAYMSPEQARGEEVDRRSDLFSFGVMLFELATGTLPFKGQTSAVIFEGILARRPCSPLELRPSLPPDLGHIITKALEKDRDLRYQTAAEIGADLRRLRRETESGRAAVAAPLVPATRGRRWWVVGSAIIVVSVVLAWFLSGERRSGVSSSAIDSVAVLPFVNSDANADAEYLSEGLTNTLINSLSRLHSVRVVPRTLIAKYKGRGADLRQVARDLGVRAVVTGRLSQRGDTLDIQVELVDASNESQLWGEQYHRGISDVLGVEQEILKAIVDNLRPGQSGPELRRDTRNTEAYQLYLKGSYYWNRRTADDTKRSIDFYQRALAADPSYALAYAGLADAYLLAEYLPTSEAFPKAKAAAEKALVLDDAIAEAHASLALVEQRDADWATAGQEFQRAIARNPNYATAHHWYGQYLLHVKRSAEALREARTAQRLDPLSLTISTDVGLTYAFMHQYSAALDEYRKVLGMDPNFVRAIRWSGMALEQEHRYDEAIAALQRASALDPTGTSHKAALAHAQTAAGHKPLGLQMLNELVAQSKQTYVPAIDLAVAQMGLADRDTVFAWLQRAVDDGSIWIAWLDLDPRYDELRGDPRFAKLLDRLRLPH